jgi:hypothetical protein
VPRAWRRAASERVGRRRTPCGFAKSSGGRAAIELTTEIVFPDDLLLSRE